MIIKLEKTEELNGEIWFRVWADNDCLKSFCDQYQAYLEQDSEKDATAFYNSVIERNKNGFPKKETILSHTIESTQP